MFISNTGTVGIGTGSPATTLTVIAPTNAGIVVNDGTVNSILYNSTGGRSSIGTTTAHPVDFYSNNSVKATLAANGNFGVGTNTPAVSLDLGSKTDAVYLPKGTTAQRPSAATGLMRYNTSGQWMEYYDGQEWVPMVFGATLYTWTNNTQSAVADATFKVLDSFSCPNFDNRPKVLSASFDGYIQAGSYYWTWRLYNSTRSAVLPTLGGYHSYNSFVTSGGGIQYRGNVHVMSSQPARAFDASACVTGDTIQLQLSAGSQDGVSVVANASQTLYVDNTNYWMGALVGKQTDTWWTS